MIPQPRFRVSIPTTLSHPLASTTNHTTHDLVSVFNTSSVASAFEQSKFTRMKRETQVYTDVQVETQS